MRTLANTTLAVTTLACFWLLGLATAPGGIAARFDGLPIVGSPLLLLGFFVVTGPLLGTLLLCLIWGALQTAALHKWVKWKQKPRAERGPLPRIRLALIPIALGLTAAALFFQLPTRAGFALARDDFQPLTQNMTAKTPQVSAVNATVGIYRVRAVGVDPRGGVYFMLNHTTGSLSGCTTSYGFAHQPNQQGTPFGDQHYRFTPLGGGWYAFRASKAS
ncbi:MAG: hypothetical protein AAGA57_11240 [Planctomycetota bacterium]